MSNTTPPKQLEPPKRVKNLVNEIAEKVHQEFGNNVQNIWFGSWVTGNATQIQT